MKDQTPLSRGVGLLHTGGGSGASRVGNTDHANAWATPVIDVATGTFYDVKPSVGSKRLVSLDCESDLSMGVSLVFSYDFRLPGEETPPRPDKRTVREFAAYIEFGAGNGAHQIEVDIAEGTRVSLYTNTCEVSLLDYSLEPRGEEGEVLGPYWQLESRGSAGYLPGPAQGVKTQRCYAPQFVSGAASVAAIQEEFAQALVDLGRLGGGGA